MVQLFWHVLRPHSETHLTTGDDPHREETAQKGGDCPQTADGQEGPCRKNRAQRAPCKPQAVGRCSGAPARRGCALPPLGALSSCPPSYLKPSADLESQALASRLASSSLAPSISRCSPDRLEHIPISGGPEPRPRLRQKGQLSLRSGEQQCWWPSCAPDPGLWASSQEPNHEACAAWTLPSLFPRGLAVAATAGVV